LKDLADNAPDFFDAGNFAASVKGIQDFLDLGFADFYYGFVADAGKDIAVELLTGIASVNFRPARLGLFELLPGDISEGDGIRLCFGLAFAFFSAGVMPFLMRSLCSRAEARASDREMPGYWPLVSNWDLPSNVNCRRKILLPVGMTIMTRPGHLPTVTL
jgi:hypothetical protein